MQHSHASNRPSICTRRARRTAVAATTGLLVIGSATAASAHVHVDPSTTAAGGSTQLAFSVPTESDTASTTKVQVLLPTDTPFEWASAQAIPGWSVKVQRTKLKTPVKLADGTLTEAPTTVTWTAEAGSAVGPGQYQVFSITAGPLPGPGTRILLPTKQTYSDGKVVDWDEPTPAGGAEPENPAPELTTTAAVPGGGDGDQPSVTAATPPTAQGAQAAQAGGDATARWLGGAGLAVGLLSLLLAGSTALRPRTRPARPPAESHPKA